MPRSIPLCLFTFSFVLYSVLSPGRLNVDARVRLEVARSLLAGEGPVASQYHQVEFEGRGYSFYGIGQSLLFLPGEVLLVGPLEKLVPRLATERSRELVHALTLFPVMGALAQMLLYGLLRELGRGRRTALVYTLVVGTATPLLCNFAFVHEISQVVALLCGGSILLARGARERRPALWWAGTHLVFLTVWFRPVHGLDVLAWGVWAVWLWNRTRPFSFLHVLGAGVSAATPAAVWMLIYNRIRTGDPLLSPYTVYFRNEGVEPFSLPFTEGLFGALLSPDFGMLFWCPLTAVAVARLGRWRDPGLKPLAVVGLVAMLASVLFFARYVSYAGHHSYGPRFQSHLIPFLLLPLVELVEHPARWFRWMVSGCVVLTVMLKALTPSVEFLAQPWRPENDYAERAGTHWPGRVPMRFVTLPLKMTGRLEPWLEERRGAPLDYRLRRICEWDFFWARVLAFGGAEAVVLVGWAVILSAIGVGAVILLKKRGQELF